MKSTTASRPSMEPCCDHSLRQSCTKYRKHTQYVLRQKHIGTEYFIDYRIAEVLPPGLAPLHENQSLNKDVSRAVSSIALLSH